MPTFAGNAGKLRDDIIDVHAKVWSVDAKDNAGEGGRAQRGRASPAREGEPGIHIRESYVRAKKGRVPGNDFEKFEPTWRRIQLMPGDLEE